MWRGRVILREGLNSISSGGAVSAALIAGSSLIVGAGALADTLVVSSISTAETQWYREGGTVLIASIPDSTIDSMACESLNTIDGVDSAFGDSRLPEPLSATSAPGVQFSVVGATSGVYDFFELDRPTAIVSAYIQGAIGDGPSLELQRASPTDASNAEGGDRQPKDVALTTSALGLHRSVSLADLSILGDEYSGTVIVPMPLGGSVEHCFVRSEAWATDYIRSIASATLGDGASHVVISDRYISGRYTRDFSQELSDRATRELPLAGGAVVGFLWLAVCWFRRAEDGLYETLGLSVGRRLLLRAFEWAVTLMLSATLTWVLVLGAASLITLDPRMLAVTGRALAASYAIALLMTLPSFGLPRRDVLKTLKDR